MFIFGIIIHLTFLFSIFDIYFKSPIVRNVIPYQPRHDAPADRLVLFVVDGLRAESFVNYTTMPFLRSIANSYGRWGISHTRVPTESRPGHVAIIGGFYEDPSAVAKGWKENPVDFDSVFNQSSFTWCWGAYDIVDIFTKEIVDNHIFAEKFDPYDQSFNSNKNTTLLDEWVFKKVEELLYDSNSDKLVYEKLHSKKTIFFLHLLGTDTAGHTHKPKTQNFLTTVKFVDENIEKVEKAIRQFYNNDGRTSFLMTSDHGMTDWGSHGTGDDHETQTPYVFWGAGVQQVNDDVYAHDPETNYMSIKHRFDLNQADLTPLMATILSIPVPVNSIGQLPIELLNMSLPNKAKALYSNSRQLLSQYNKKRIDVEANAIPFLYIPYKPFDNIKVKEIIDFTEQLLKDEQYEKLMIISKEIMHLSQQGLEYYHNYYQRPLLITVTLSFVGWIFYLLKFLLQQNIFIQAEILSKPGLKTSMDYLLKVISLFTCLISCFMIYVQNLPMQYYIYFLLPIWLWLYALTPLNIWSQTVVNLQRHKKKNILFVEMLCYVLGSVMLGLSFTYRWVLSIPLLGMSLWPFFSSYNHVITKSVSISWAAGCVLLSIFSFMPVVGKQVVIELVLLAGLIWLLTMGVYLYITYNKNNGPKTEMSVSLLQIVLLILSLIIIYRQSRNFDEGLAISQLLQTVCWAIALTLPVLSLLYSKNLVHRLMGINTSILIFYLLLSVSHEGLFMVTLIFNVNCWMMIEFKLLNLEKTKNINECFFGGDSLDSNEKNLISIERSLSSHDFRRAFFFTLYIILSYFGTGNIASLNSFEVRWVICFTTSFRPFVITSLILLKTLAPFLSVACSFRAVQHFTKAPTGYLNIIVLIFSNIMGLHLLYHVKNIGSWLEIGTSISQYVIVQVITLFIVLINQIAKWLTEIEIKNVTISFFENRKKNVIGAKENKNKKNYSSLLFFCWLYAND